ncbi:hypothetical protein ABIF38_006421 [Bradyrhizobium japonicum]|uniref:DUF3168 domain-containing protein n=1 Tax=Bradyrhizobium elkanii TaxID=29448 RepID=UPI00037A13CF|nr:DUF3168 domain-containing protein [Bradyrhizobium elkanii]WAX24352.1 DUF3168 domain-containing protein [Bradyrhizobium phage ppBeUSDA76-1]MCP1731271.1 hypothetical protein [Bradyrhizobium elkanii]MCS3575400.1 hypothetical protein [Bradyrhizobium elkanii]MCS3591909.1 hypothetical protein [Bradyrhizobium elkanii]MCS3621354.1 hypothetical protein [Bradyrhizobium elkanii]
MSAIVDQSGWLQTRIVGLLKAGATAAADRIYCPVPPAAKFPYVSIGDVQVINQRFECLQGAEYFVTVHAWSRERSKLEIRSLGKQITALLDDADISDGEVSVNTCEIDNSQYIDDPDGNTFHAALTFHVLTD